MNISPMKKIILSSNMLWTITQFRLGLIKALVKAGYEVVCIANTDNFSDISEKKVEDAGARFSRVELNRKGINPIQDIRYLFGLINNFRKERPALVINYSIKPIIYGSMAAWLCKVPSLAVTTGLGFSFISNNLLTRTTRFLYKLGLLFTKKVYFLNAEDRDIFLKHKLVKASKTALLPSEGVDTDYYHPVPQPSEKNDFSFILIARLLWEKGIGEYVESARLIRANENIRTRFRLAGYIDTDNPGAISREQIQQWVDEGIIIYEGTTDDVRPLLISSDCLVLPSYYREGVPRTLLEAAAMQLPLIASNNVGCREVVDHGINGLMCEPRNHLDLSEKMAMMIHLTSAEREKMGKAGRQKVMAQFDEKIVIDIYFREIERILGTHKS